MDIGTSNFEESDRHWNSSNLEESALEILSTLEVSRLSAKELFEHNHIAGKFNNRFTFKPLGGVINTYKMCAKLSYRNCVAIVRRFAGSPLRYLPLQRVSESFALQSFGLQWFDLQGFAL